MKKATATETMTPEAVEARRAYRREWNHRNRDKVRAAQRRYWEKRAAAEHKAGTDPDGGKG